MVMALAYAAVEDAVGQLGVGDGAGGLQGADEQGEQPDARARRSAVTLAVVEVPRDRRDHRAGRPSV